MNTSTPAAMRPASKADSNIYPDTRVSFPINTLCLFLECFLKTVPAAHPVLSMKSAVIGKEPTVPLIPSVPKYFFFTDYPYPIQLILKLKELVWSLKCRAL